MTSDIETEKSEMEKLYLGLAVQAQKHFPETVEKRKRVIILAGPTACGKSAFALELAKMVKGEIISADSMQVYKGMDIGTAKPSPEDCEVVPHHLIDTHEVTDPFNVVDFYYESRQCCEQILARNRVPIIVGGAGFYIHSLIYGPPSGPPSVGEVRQRIEKELEQKGADDLYEQLMQRDPIYAKSITKHDKQKIVRGLEIIALTGKKVSDLAWKGKHKPLNYDFRCWFLYRPRENLYQRIDERCDEMLENGFLDEVRMLQAKGIHQNNSAAQAIGYRQALEYLRKEQNKEEYEKFVTEFKKVTRHYAKRQRTWFAKEPLFHWVDLDLHDHEVIMDMIAQDLDRRV